MANEITVYTRLKVEKGNLKYDRNVSGLLRTLTGDALGGQVQAIPTTANGTALVVPAAIGTAGYAFFRNLDSTNYIELGVQSGGTLYPFAKLYAGDVALVPLTTTAVYAMANTATVNLEYCMVEK